MLDVINYEKLQEYKFKGKEYLLVENNLPNPFIKPDGKRVQVREEWEDQRSYLKEMLDYYMYGKTPPPPKEVRGEVVYHEYRYNNKAIFEKVSLIDEAGLEIEAEVIRPSKEGKFPVVVWNQFSDMEACPMEEEAICMGYAILSFNRNQFAPDDEGCIEFTGGAFHSKYPEYKEARAIAIWAWGCSYCVSWLKNRNWAESFIVTGMSRGGKVALRAAAFDERFAVCAPVSSGNGGAGCFRYAGGRLGLCTQEVESLGWMLRKDRFWYWFKDELAEFGNSSNFSAMGEENKIPFDLHTVRSLIAPRAIICTEGLDDNLSNCYGTQVTWRAADEVYEFLGAIGVNGLSYSEGGHEFTLYRWKVIFDFCEVVLRHKIQKIEYRRSSWYNNSSYLGYNGRVKALHFNFD